MSLLWLIEKALVNWVTLFDCANVLIQAFCPLSTIYMKVWSCLASVRHQAAKTTCMNSGPCWLLVDMVSCLFQHLSAHEQVFLCFLTVAETRFLSALLISSSVHKRTVIRPWLTVHETCALSKHFFSSRKHPSADQALCIVCSSILAVVFGQQISFRVSFR